MNLGMLDWLFQTCPNCSQKTWRKILRNELKSTEKVYGTQTRWTRSGGMQIEEPVTLWLYSYEVEHNCRKCGHVWTEHVTKQRPW